MTPTSDDSESGLRLRLLLVLALLSATAPLAIDVYLPSFPEVRDALDTGATQVQLTLSAFFLGLAVGQVAWGPISDRIGRRRPLLIGTSISTVAALVASLAPTIEVLIGARFIQALAGAAAVVVTQAVIADLFHGFRAARVLSLMGSIVATTPVVAPVIGGALATFVSWRVVLGVVFVFTLLQVLAVLTTIPETLPEAARTPASTTATSGACCVSPRSWATSARSGSGSARSWPTSPRHRSSTKR